MGRNGYRLGTATIPIDFGEVSFLLRASGFWMFFDMFGIAISWNQPQPSVLRHRCCWLFIYFYPLTSLALTSTLLLAHFWYISHDATCSYCTTSCQRPKQLPPRCISAAASARKDLQRTVDGPWFLHPRDGNGGSSISLTATSPITAGDPEGIDSAGTIQKLITWGFIVEQKTTDLSKFAYSPIDHDCWLSSYLL